MNQALKIIREKNRHDAPGTGSDKQHPDTPPPPFEPKKDNQKQGQQQPSKEDKKQL